VREERWQPEMQHTVRPLLCKDCCYRCENLKQTHPWIKDACAFYSYALDPTAAPVPFVPQAVTPVARCHLCFLSLSKALDVPCGALTRAVTARGFSWRFGLFCAAGLAAPRTRSTERTAPNSSFVQWMHGCKP
jgi:hypothetical protein